MSQEEMMDLMEHMQTELEQVKSENENLKKTIKKQTGEMQLMNEQIVKMSESDKELEKARELKQESERAKAIVLQDKKRNDISWQQIYEERKKIKEKEQELETIKQNTKDKIEEQTHRHFEIFTAFRISVNTVNN